MMVRDFGEDRVEKVNFTAGTSGTKLQLKQDDTMTRQLHGNYPYMDR
jgi:hypothetical protein